MTWFKSARGHWITNIDLIWCTKFLQKEIFLLTGCKIDSNKRRRFLCIRRCSSSGSYYTYHTFSYLLVNVEPWYKYQGSQRSGIIWKKWHFCESLEKVKKEREKELQVRELWMSLQFAYFNCNTMFLNAEWSAKNTP